MKPHNVLIKKLLDTNFIVDGDDLEVQLYMIAMTLTTICKPSKGTMMLSLFGM